MGPIRKGGKIICSFIMNEIMQRRSNLEDAGQREKERESEGGRLGGEKMTSAVNTKKKSGHHKSKDRNIDV